MLKSIVIMVWKLVAGGFAAISNDIYKFGKIEMMHIPPTHRRMIYALLSGEKKSVVLSESASSFIGTDLKSNDIYIDNIMSNE